MGLTAGLLFIIGLVATAFGAWGQHTDAGRTKYDEMAGMIPFFAFWAGIVFIAIAILLWIVIAVKR